LQEGARLGFGPTPTPSGILEVHIEVGKGHCRVELDIEARNTAPEVHLELPGFEQKTIQRLDRPVRIELEALPP
jgi:hypothetical protein